AWEALQKLDHTLNEVIDPAAVVARDDAERGADRDDDQRGDERERQRDTGTQTDAPPQIAPELVGAQQEDRLPILDAVEMQAAWEDAEQLVFIALHKEFDRRGAAEI